MIEYDVLKILFSSSCAVYGIPNKTPIDELSEIKPINPYGQTKVIFEQILSDYDNAYNLKYCSLRYFNAAGADPDGNIGEAHAPETHIIPLIFNSTNSIIISSNCLI